MRQNDSPSTRPASSPEMRERGAERALGLLLLVDLVNEIAPGDPVTAPERWRDVLLRHGADAADLATQPPPHATAVLAAVARLRALFAVREMAELAAHVNPVLAAEGARPRLAEVRPGAWAVRAETDEDGDPALRVLVVGAFALAAWAAERGRIAWGICAAAGCNRAFIDEGRRAPQRFCRPVCATRSRVRAHRARLGG